MTTFSEGAINSIKEKYSDTTLAKCNVGWLSASYKDNKTQSISDIVLNHIESKVLHLTTFSAVISGLTGVAKLLDNDFPLEAEAVRIAITEAQVLTKGMSGPNRRSLVLPTHEDAMLHVKSLDNSLQRVLAYISVTTGALPQDYLRDTHRLQMLRKGVIDVGRKLDRNHLLPRVLTFDGDKVKELDPEGLAGGALANAVPKRGSVGLVSDKKIGSMLNGTGYTFYQLRNSWAIHQRLDGKDWKTIGSEAGVMDYMGFRNRVIAIAAENGITIN